MAGIENFGSIVLEARRRAGMTQEAFASKLGITPQAVSKWENGLGYPDVTLFPEIADVLGIPIESLFGVESDQGKTVPFPQKKDGLNYIFSHNNRACYSSKTPERIDSENHIAYFTDGSRADLERGNAVNVGGGEIRFIEAEDHKEGFEGIKGDLCRDFSDFSSVTAKLTMPCEFRIKSAEDGKGRVVASGSSIFLSHLITAANGDTLEISFKKSILDFSSRTRNTVTVYLPCERGSVFKISVNGSSDCDIEPDCGILEISIAGSGDVFAADCNRMDCRIAASGDVKVGHVAFGSNISISGCGDVEAESLCAPLITIAGSGSVKANEIKGDEMNINISGSGDVECGGEVDTLKLKVNGSGEFDAPKLIVGEAHISVAGGGDIVIGRIKRASYEALGKSTTLKVLARGEE
jgi:transcriptional regulator with XRE-family HTH domain